MRRWRARTRAPSVAFCPSQTTIAVWEWVTSSRCAADGAARLGFGGRCLGGQGDGGGGPGQQLLVAGSEGVRPCRLLAGEGQHGHVRDPCLGDGRCGELLGAEPEAGQYQRVRVGQP